MDAAVKDGQHNISTMPRPQRLTAGALDRAEVRDPEQAESDQEDRQILQQWRSDGMRRGWMKA